MSAPTLEPASGHIRNETQSSSAAGAPSSRLTNGLAIPKEPPSDGVSSAEPPGAADRTTRESQRKSDDHSRSALAGQSSRPATDGVIPKDCSSDGSKSSAVANEATRHHERLATADETTRGVQENSDTQHSHDLAGANFLADHSATDAQWTDAGGEQDEGGLASTIVESEPIRGALLADPLLALLADVREDAQRNRIANENRLRHLTRTEADKDGEDRGLGLDERHPDVARLAALVQMLADVEHQATLNLNRRMRQHPLGPWLKAQRGVGHGTLPARLLAIIGDPYVNMQTGEVRMVSQLWSYCGHGDASRKRRKGMSQADLFALGNPDAKMIVHLIAESCMKAGGPYREVYDARKAATEGREHAAECIRCGPSGKPALPGSPWSNAHRHADALRIVGKAILRDLWLEAKRLHGGAA